MNPDFITFCRQLQDEAKQAFQRRGIVFCGARNWGRAAAAKALQTVDCNTVLWISDQAPNEDTPTLAASQAHKLLGTELDALIFDAYAGFDPDAFGAALGTLRGGGLLLLIAPPLTHWEAFHDPQNARIAVAPVAPEALSGRFLKRVANIIAASSAVTMVEPGTALISRTVSPSPPTKYQHEASLNEQAVYRTQDQQLAVQALIQVAKGHRRRPAVLISDRGRGKSAALGIAAAHLLQSGLTRIIITGPRLEAITPALEQARRLLLNSDSGRGHVRSGPAEFCFVPPDILSLGEQATDLVLVDEAAALPAPMLERLLLRYSRIAFATTIHGYEGSGRGFAVRFRKFLDKHRPQWREIRLEQPIRWAANDPLEHLTFQALLLDAAPASDAAVSGLTAEACEFIRLDRERLLGDEAQLRQLFGLLVLAHYRTSPMDLRHLLDGPNISICVLRHAQRLPAIALLADEGGFSAQDALQIFLGKRRFRGHLLPQSLSQHLGLEQAPRLRCRRIMRIAVHPSLQGKGFGTRLLHEIRAQAHQEDMDYLGSSFAADRQLLNFWRDREFTPVRLGISRDASSGAHSASVLQPLSNTGLQLLATAVERFSRHFPHMLADALQDLEAGLALDLMSACQTEHFPHFSQLDWRDLISIALAARVYEVSPETAWRLVRFALSDAEALSLLDPQSRTLLMSRVLQRRDWKTAATLSGLSGRKQATARFRQALGCLLDHYAHGAVRDEMHRIGGMRQP